MNIFYGTQTEILECFSYEYVHKTFLECNSQGFNLFK